MIILGSDHGGFLLKQQIKAYLDEQGEEYEDAGALTFDEVDDYPQFAFLTAQEVLKDPQNKGILICGAGIGMSIAVNRKKGIRGALCTSVEMARLAREHNDANVLILGGRITKKGLALKILKTFLNTTHLGGKHQKRVDQLDA